MSSLAIVLTILSLAIVALAFVLLRFFLLNLKLKQDVAAKNLSLAFLQEQKNSLEVGRNTLELQLEIANKELKVASEKLIVLEQEKLYLEREKTNLKEQTKENSERMQKDFELLSNRIFNELKVKFSEENQDKISNLLKPFKGDLKEFALQLERMTEANTSKHASLVEQIKYLGELNKKVSDDANMLAKALKSDNKTAGDWGEMILEKMLESCGLLEGEHFFKQNSLKNAEGDNLRPDILLKLPEDRVVVIDAKVSLVDFLKYTNGEISQQDALKSFKQSVTRHIKTLSVKKYEDLVALKTPEFVMIFIPIEGAFSLISRKLQDVFELAYANKIVLASPSTLLSALKTIEFLWRVDKQEKNTAKIAEIGGFLHERVNRFLERFKELGQRVEAMQKAYTNTKTTLYDSNLGVVQTAKKLEDLGAKTKAKIEIDTE